MVCLKVGRRTWTQSVQGAVATWSVIGMRYSRRFSTPIDDQVARAPCTDCVQGYFRTFEAKPQVTAHTKDGALGSGWIDSACDTGSDWLTHTLPRVVLTSSPEVASRYR